MQIAGDVLLWFVFGVMAALVIINGLIMIMSAFGHRKEARDLQDMLTRCVWFLRLGNTH
jgi:hypothetical protein